MDDADSLVLEIIGKGSPVLQGIGVPDSMEQNEFQESETNGECETGAILVKPSQRDCDDETNSAACSSKSINKGTTGRQHMIHRSKLMLRLFQCPLM